MSCALYIQAAALLGTELASAATPPPMHVLWWAFLIHAVS